MVQVYTRWIRVQINELDRAKETVTRLADCDDIIGVWRVGQALVWIQFSGAAALHFFVKGADFLLLFFRTGNYSDKCSDIVRLGRAARGEFLTGC